MRQLLPHLLLSILLGTSPLLLRAQEEPKPANTPSEQPTSDEDQDRQDEDAPSKDSGEQEIEEESSAMPPQREKKSDVPSAREDELDTLNEVDVRENLGPDPTRLLEDPLILKTDEDRKRELIQKHMDLAAQLLNSWTLPLLGTSLASRAEEEERLAQLEAFKERQKRDLEALKEIDEQYYRERREEYYDTVIQAQGDRWEDPSDSSF